MRTFGASFNTEIALDAAEPFLTAVFRFPTGTTVYVSDRDATIGGKVHLPIIAWPDGWGELASVIDRQELRLDVQAITLAFINYPLPSELTFPSGVVAGQRWSDVLQARPEATEVDIYQNMRRASDSAIFQELLFTGVIQGGPTGWSYERVQCRVVSLTEKYLLGDCLRTVDPEVFKFAHDRDVNAAVPLSIGNTPRGIGRVVKGALVSKPFPEVTNNPASGELTAVEIDNVALHQAFPGYIAGGDYGGINTLLKVQFTSGIDFYVYNSYIATNQTGKITEDFTSTDGVLKIPSASWQGIFVAGDIFDFYVDTTRSEVEFSDMPEGASFDGIDTIYANDVALSENDVLLEVQEGNSVNLGVGVDAAIGGGTYVHHDGYSSGTYTHEDLYPSMGPGTGPDPNGRVRGTAIVAPFTVPGVIASGRLIGVALAIARNNTPPPLHIYIADTFNPFGNGNGVFGGAGKSYMFFSESKAGIAEPPNGLLFTPGEDPPLPKSATSVGSGESFIARSPTALDPTWPTGDYFGNGIWFPIQADVVPGRTYFVQLSADNSDPTVNRTASGTEDFYSIGMQAVGGATYGYQTAYITPPPPAKTYVVRADQYFGQAWRYDWDAEAWTKVFSNSGAPMGIWITMLYSGGVLRDLNPGAPSAVPGSESYFQQLKLNRGILATQLGVSFLGDPTAEGSALVNLWAAEDTGQSRAIVGSVRITAQDVRARTAGQYRMISKYLPKPTLLRTGFYNIEVVGEVDAVTRRQVGFTAQGGTAFSSGGGFLTSGSGPGGATYSVWSRSPSGGAGTQLQTITTGDPISLGVKITAARMTREINVADDAGAKVARVTFNTWLPDELILTADLRGLRLSGSRSPEKIFEMLLEADGKGPLVAAARIDLAGSFAATGAALAALGYTFDGQVIDQQSWKQLLLRLAFECRCVFDWSVDKARLKFTPTVPGSPVATIDYADTLARGLVPEVTVVRSDVTKLINSIDLLYSRKYHHPGEQAWAGKLHGEDTVSIGIYGRREKPDLFKMQMVRSRAMAQSLVDFYKARFANPKNSATVETALPQLAIEKDDQIQLTNI